MIYRNLRLLDKQPSDCSDDQELSFLCQDRSPSDEQHEALVSNLCIEMRNFDCRWRSHRYPPKAPYNAPGDISGLNRIIGIDALTAKVEANVTMESLVQATLRLGLLPSVVAGARNMTVADAFARTTKESSSFAYGTFDSTVLEIEVILSDGKLVKARPDLNSSLFYGSAGAMNSLGLTTMFEISLVRRGPYVELEILPLSLLPREIKKMQDFVRKMQRESSNKPEKGSLMSMATEKMQRASSNLPVEDTLLSAAMMKMLWASSDSSVEFVEAVMFKHPEKMEATQKVSSHYVMCEKSSGVIIGRTCLTVPTAREETSESQSFYKLAECAMRAADNNKEVQIHYMTTISYLFRNDDRKPMQARNRKFEFFQTKSPTVAQPASQPVFQSFGVCFDAVEGIVQTFQQDWNISPIWRCPVLSPRRVGRECSLGIGCALVSKVHVEKGIKRTMDNDAYFMLDFQHLEAVCYGTIDRILSKENPESGKNEAKTRPKGYRVLHCRTPSALGAAWVLHDHRWYAKLRSQWKSDVFADVSERLWDPARFGFS